MFTIRVYGIVVNRKGEILLTDEYRMGQRMTKFPGGGLHYGEGTLECLKREFQEELDRVPFNIRHFYTTDFFQPTALITPPKQLISIYYEVDIEHVETIPVTERVFDFDEVEGAQTFRWIKTEHLNASVLTFPIDQKVAEMLYQKYTGGFIAR
jgi:8-oxo-dGTP diphosphatase